MAEPERDHRAFVRRVQARTLVLALGVATGLTLIFSLMVGLGFLAGALVSMVNFQLMAVDASDFAGKGPDEARSHAFKRFGLRYLIMAGFLAVVITRTDLNVAAVFAGLFIVQVVLLAGEIGRAARNGAKPRA